METTKKAKSKKADNKGGNQVSQAYREYVLTEGKRPTTVFKFCKEIGIKEEEFYAQFASFDALEKSIWTEYVAHTRQRMEADKAYTGFSAREKILTFYFSLAELLKSDRSFVLHQLQSIKTPAVTPVFLKGFKAAFTEWISSVLNEGKATGEIAKRPYLDERYHTLFWLHMMFILQFWAHDDSVGFEKTDVAIEKSVTLAFDLIGKGVLDNALDFGKFLYQQSKKLMAIVKEQEQIPTGKVQRATKFITTGAKIGGNYLKHYSKKLINPELSKDELHADNASDIYNSLSQLKGSALKVAQMLSMDKNLLPTAYQNQFAMAQYSAPPLSYPLVVRTFEKYFKKRPTEIFDTFTTSARNAASIGQVHEATLKGKKLAVKIQYPGVGDSIKSDLAMVKPIALRMFKLNATEYDEFIQEVQARMLEEADYTLELKRSINLSKQCNDIENLVFPTYYPQQSSEKILTMDWLEGKPLGEFLKTEKLTKVEANRIGQAMWDFYHFQIHQLKELHADPHPGNFIITNDKKLGIIDFGCVKVIPKDFYPQYFQLLERDILQNKAKLENAFYQLRFIYPDDTAKDKKFFTEIFTHLVELLGRPFRSNEFDFDNSTYFEEVFTFGEQLSNMKELRESKKARGVKDAIYINRTYFGLYNLLYDLKAKVNTTSWV